MKFYVRLYIDKTTNKIMMCETDQNEIKRSLIKFSGQGDNGRPLEVMPYAVTKFCIEDMTGGTLGPIRAHEFVEDISDDGQAKFGTSILRVKPDYTVELCNESAKKNLGVLKTCKGLRITECEVIHYGD